MYRNVNAPSNQSQLQQLGRFLQRLDIRLEQAIASIPKTEGSVVTFQAGQDLLKASTSPRSRNTDSESLPRQPAQASRTRKPTTPALPDINEIVKPGSRLAWLQARFELSVFELDVIAIALAPELDQRYGQTYAYLQGETHRHRPTVDLALNLLCPSASEKLAHRLYFSAESALLDHQLLQLVPPADQPQATLLAHELVLDGPVIRFLLGEWGRDRRLVPFCEFLAPAPEPETLGFDLSEHRNLLTLVGSSSLF